MQRDPSLEAIPTPPKPPPPEPIDLTMSSDDDEPLPPPPSRQQPSASTSRYESRSPPSPLPSSSRHVSTLKAQINDAVDYDTHSRGRFFMYSITFPRPKWDPVKEIAIQEIKDFKDQMFAQLPYMVVKHKLHAAFIEQDERGHPNAIVLQAVCVQSLYCIAYTDSDGRRTDDERL